MGLSFHPSGSHFQLPASVLALVYVTAVLATSPLAQAGALARASYNILCQMWAAGCTSLLPDAQGLVDTTHLK
jgi:hypothetical protein